VKPASDAVAFGTAAESLRVRMARGLVWNLIGTATLQGSTFIINIAVANLLGRRVFGEYAIVQSTVVLLTAVVQWATGYTATKYLAEFRSIDPPRAGRLLGLLAVVSGVLAGTLALLLLVGAKGLAIHVLNNPELSRPLMIASGAVLFGIANVFLIGVLAGLESYPAFGRAGVIAGASTVVACVIGAKTGGLSGAVVGLLVGGMIQSATLGKLVAAETARHGIAMEFAGIRTESNLLLKYAVPVALSGLVTLPAIWVANTLLVRQPGGYDALAVFAAANSFRIMVVFLPSIVNSVSLSLLNNQRGLGDERRFRRIFWFNVSAAAIVAAAAATAITLFGRVLLTVFGRDFGAGYPVLLVLIAATVPESVTNAMIQLVHSRERSWLALRWVTIPGFGTLVVAAWVLTPIAGAVGLAWAYVIAWAVALACTCVVVAKLGIRPNQLSRIGISRRC
jgi:O-antigen/teichoic acid export membrane protein